MVVWVRLRVLLEMRRVLEGYVGAMLNVSTRGSVTWPCVSISVGRLFSLAQIRAHVSASCQCSLIANRPVYNIYVSIHRRGHFTSLPQLDRSVAFTPLGSSIPPVTPTADNE